MSAYLPALAYLGLWLLLAAGIALLQRALAGKSVAAPEPGPSVVVDDDPGAQWQRLARLGLIVVPAALLLLLWASSFAGKTGPAALLPGLILLAAILVGLLHIARRGALPGTPDEPDPQ